jgi:hypothetical protein
MVAVSATLVAGPALAQSVSDTVSRDAQRIQEREQERQRAREDQFLHENLQNDAVHLAHYVLQRNFAV